MHPALNQFRCGDDIPQAPSGDGTGFGKGTAGEGSVKHSRQAGNIGIRIRIHSHISLLWQSKYRVMVCLSQD